MIRFNFSRLMVMTTLLLSFNPCKGNTMTSTDIPLRQKIGQMIMVGFHATKPSESQVLSLSKKIEQGLVGGVIFFRYNIVNPKQTCTLTQHFQSLKTSLPLLLAVDQEGGKVQRLNAKNGFKDYRSAKNVAKNLTPKEAFSHYSDMAKTTASAGFNVVFGPVVDLDHNPTLESETPLVNPVIGGLERAYGADPRIIVEYASQFINAHHQQGILTSLKHFPGHGLAPSDTHIDLTDVTNTYEADLELAPYEALSEKGLIDMVMTAHVMMRNLDENHPATLSPTILKELLREGDHPYDGVVISDDLFMGAIQKNYRFEEIVLLAVEADVDILLFSINTAAQKGINAEDQKPVDANLVDKIIDIIEEAVKSGRLTQERINKSYDRIIKMKQAL
ncbi:MAG TPA: glycosyl hydrolase [Holosporales bacterium]|nr:glycosyl hydrolase [Holosporales bacterium]